LKSDMRCRQQFQFFGNGVGLDALGTKGIYGVKLDLSSIMPSKVLFVFIAHFQVRRTDRTT
jgi:hypothetical protein